MQLICLELSHWHCPVSFRERFSFNEEQSRQFYKSIELANSRFCESEIVSTCNRTEFLAVCSQADQAPADLKLEAAELLAEFHAVDVGQLRQYAEWHHGDAAINHICRVAAGLESQVLGESEILGQVIRAHQVATEEGSAGNVLRRVLKACIRSGKRARTETPINRHAASVGTVTVRLAYEALGRLTDKQVAVIGTGAMGQVAAHAFKRDGVKDLILLNRTPAKAKPLADKLGYKVQSLETLDQVLANADVVVAATAAPHCLVSKAQMVDLQAARNKPLLLIDIAVPRNIESGVGEIPGVTLFDMDYLSDRREDAMAQRQGVIPQVEAIISAEVATCLKSLEGVKTEETIGLLRRRAEQIRLRELERILKQVPATNDPLREQIQHFSRALVNKLLHQPTHQLRQSVNTENAAQYDATFKDLFQL